MNDKPIFIRDLSRDLNPHSKRLFLYYLVVFSVTIFALVCCEWKQESLGIRGERYRTPPPLPPTDGYTIALSLGALTEIIAGRCEKLTAEISVNGKAFNTENPVNISLTGDDSVAFYEDKACTIDTKSITIPAGNSQVVAYFLPSESKFVHIQIHSPDAIPFKADIQVKKPAEVVSAFTGLNFGNLLISSSSTGFITLTNQGDVQARFTLPALLSTPFSFSGGLFPGIGGDCGEVLPKGVSCKISLQFSPQQDGLYNATLVNEYDNGVKKRSLNIELAGVGMLPARLNFAETPSHDFGSVTVGSSVQTTLTIANSGDVPAELRSFSGLLGPFMFTGGLFPGAGGSCWNLLAARTSCTLSVTFTPNEVRDFSENFNIAYFNGLSEQSVSLMLKGSGSGSSIIMISEAPIYDFGAQTIGSVIEKTLVLENKGVLSARDLVATLNAPFGFKGGQYPGTGGTCGATLEPGKNCNLVVTFTPTIFTTFSTTLEVLYDHDLNAATAKVSATITLIGSAIAPANLVLLDGASFNFGRVLKNMAIEKRLFIQNTGEEMASNLVPAILPPPFIYTNGTFPGTLDSRHCGDSLSGKTTCIVSISMKPADIGKRETAWDLQYRSETGQKELNIVLSGEGIESPNTSQGLDQTFGNSGKVIQSISGNPESIISLALQNISGQSRIIVLEETQRGINRYQANGDPDLTFGTNGTRSLGTLFSTVSAIAAGADGTLFLAGTRAGPYGYADFAFTKISADGNLATPSPPRQLDFYAGHTDIPYAIAIQPYPLGQRKILIAGYWAGSYGNGQAALVRFWEDGTMDTTFDGDGKKLVGITAKEDRAYALHILPGTATDCSDCKILIAGKGGDDFFLAKLNINGSLDSSCSGDGIAFAGFSGSSGFTQSYHAAYAMAVQEDGKIVLAGVANPMDKARDFGLARFNPDCSLDTTFGNGGRTTAGFSGGIAKAVVIQSNGKIWVVGEVGIGSGNTSFGIARFLPTGDLDAGVNGNGRLSIDFGKVTERPQAMIFSDSGMPLVGGFVQDTSTDKRQILAQYFSPEFSTWNPNDKSQNIQLDIEKLTASVDPPPVSGLVRGTLGIRTGKSYFEIRVDKLGDELLDRGLGIATKKLALSGILGEQDWGCAYQPLGEVICLFGDLLKTNGFSPFLETDVIGVAYDGSHVYFSKNGVWQAGADPEKGMGGIPVQSESLYPDFFPGANVSDGDIFTINTGKTPFRYGPPHGFRAGWY